MSKAEDRALSKYPVLKTVLGDTNYLPRIGFIEGYRQAEKDNELTWEDMAFIRLAFDALEANIHLGSIKIQPMTKGYYQEVLKRFKDLKERKEKMRKITITCDRCGKEITNDINGFPHYLNDINISLNYWHGGSMGGEEDIDRLHYEICGDCARSLYRTLKKWFKETEEK